MTNLIRQDFIEKLTSLLMIEEGYRQYPYMDTMKIWTIGYGRNLQVLKLNAASFSALLKKGCTEKQALLWLQDDINTHIINVSKAIVFFDEIDDIRKCILVDMAFNMGELKLMQFKKMLSLLQSKQYKECATEMLNSNWARQVGNRAVVLSKMMITGEWP